MATINEVATQFFEACEAGEGWEACKAILYAECLVLGPGRAAGQCVYPSGVR
jgi:hypothetical protein